MTARDEGMTHALHHEADARSDREMRIWVYVIGLVEGKKNESVASITSLSTAEAAFCREVVELVTTGKCIYKDAESPRNVLTQVDSVASTSITLNLYCILFYRSNNYLEE